MDQRYMELIPVRVLHANRSDLFSHVVVWVLLFTQHAKYICSSVRFQPRMENSYEYRSVNLCNSSVDRK